MGKFKYSARDKNGREVKGDIEARDPGAVADILHDQGLVVVSIKEASILKSLEDQINTIQNKKECR